MLKSKKTYVLLLEISIVIIWGFIAFKWGPAASVQISNEHSGITSLTTSADSPQTEWISVFLNGQKIGCGLSDTISTLDGYRLHERTYMKMRAFNQDKEITSIFSAETDRQYQLKSFKYVLISPPSQIDIAGTIEGNILKLTTTNAGVSNTEQILLKETPEIALTFKNKLLSEKLKVGDQKKMPFFDPATMSRQEMLINVTKLGTATIDGKSIKTYTLETSYHGFQSNIVITEDGRTLEESNSIGMSLKRESREQAIYKGWPNNKSAVDIIALSAIPIERPIKNARKQSDLTYVLTGNGIELILSKQYKSSSLGEIRVLIPKKEEWKNYSIPMIDSKFSNELKSSSLIQKDDPKIMRSAQEIIDGNYNAIEATSKLVSWLYTRISKEPVMGIPSALEVLQTQKGDCNEHTTLFTALARSLGIPTKMAAGIVYSDNIDSSMPGFYYHAWPEVYLGKWVPVDPTFGQFPADATHIKLVEGDISDQLGILRLIGNLKVRVVNPK